ncbi:ABC transporter ATP-binding protein [Phaeodactylibacter luteus]|uniref:ABC transporter ATP-binding protein n=1 Tax=Phaeodactylibacter luteus TaxID=1564516 RepID=A0A5C6S0F6_9BACT|nr:ABC transporter ATP-binding protein [Phaeodactylibacter luteus]TXB68306.1 ABC transporter ATP-binding protein [Phaeodactylibacter luteus]
MQQPLFRIEELHCAYGNGPKVLYVPQLHIERGGLVFIVGSSGVGKSTLLETLGLMNRTIRSASRLDFFPAEGRPKPLKACWAQPDQARASFRQQYFSFVFQQTNLMPNFTAGENMMAPALLNGQIGIQDKIRAYMAQLKLPPESFGASISDLSGGQRQRLAFIRGLMAPHEVLFGDEPTGNLDRHTAHSCMELLKRELRNDDRTGIIVSHDLALADAFADQIVPILLTMNDGRTSGFIDHQQVLHREATGSFHCNGEPVPNAEQWLAARLDTPYQPAKA